MSCNSKPLILPNIVEYEGNEILLVSNQQVSFDSIFLNGSTSTPYEFDSRAIERKTLKSITRNPFNRKEKGNLFHTPFLDRFGNYSLTITFNLIIDSNFNYFYGDLHTNTSLDGIGLMNKDTSYVINNEEKNSRVESIKWNLKRGFISYHHRDLDKDFRVETVAQN